MVQAIGIELEPSGGPCGATVTGVDLTSELNETTVAAIRSAWLEHKVLAFPDQPMSDQDLERFTLRFGPFGDDTFFDSIDGHPNIAAIHRRADESSSLFADSWHADWTFQRFPPDGTCLHAKVIPPSGGDTLYADQQAALAAMPTDLRQRLEGAVAIHSARLPYAPDGSYGAGDSDDRAMKILPSEVAYETQTHPLIRIHPETGAETLYSTFGYIVGIEGMADDDSLRLLQELYRWQGRDDFQFRQRWQPDMLVMWDNRVVLHKATGGYEGHERLLHRTTIGYNPDVRPKGVPCP